MAAELTELKSSFNTHSTAINSLKKTLNKALVENDTLKQTVDLLKKKVKVQDGYINELYGQQDDLEQYTRKHAIENYMVFRKICIQQRMTWLLSSANDLMCPLRTQTSIFHINYYTEKTNRKPL